MTKNSALIVLMPTRGTISLETHEALTFNMDGVANIRATVSRKPVDQARNELAANALKIATDDPLKIGQENYVCLWVDDDAWWPPGTVTQMLLLLAANPHIDVLAGCFSVRAPFQTCVPTRVDKSQAETTTIERVAHGTLLDINRIGFHFVMHPVSLLRRLPERPFDITAGDSTEDWEFSARASEIGARMAVATGCMVAHIDVKSGEAFLPCTRAGRIIGNRFVPNNDPRTDEEMMKEIGVPERRHYGEAIDEAITRLEANASPDENIRIPQFADGAIA